jgi:predicted RNA-binding Zn ribbon-like protein
MVSSRSSVPSGRRLCLDFINTVENRPTAAPRELLPTYDDLLAWSRQSRILTFEEAERLRTRAKRRRDEARRTLSRARRLRERLFRIFSVAAQGRGSAADTSQLAPELKRAFRFPALRARRLVWEDDRDELDGMLGPIVRSAVELWTSPEIERVRVCAAEDCEWLFLDESRNRSRRWCEMTVCGNRAKARRYYLRKRSRPPSRRKER